MSLPSQSFRLVIKSRSGREWEQGVVLALADNQCRTCFGQGHKRYKRRVDERAVCDCVLRRVFTRTLNKYRQCRDNQENLNSRVVGDRRGGFSMKGEEFMADFEITARRAVKARRLRIEVFELHVLGRLEWRECLKRIKDKHLDRGNFFHEVYRIQQELGRAFYEVAPFALFPTDQYFSTPVRDERVSARLASLPPVSVKKERARLFIVPRPEPLEPVPSPEPDEFQPLEFIEEEEYQPCEEAMTMSFAGCAC